VQATQLISANPLIARVTERNGTGKGQYVVLDQAFNPTATIPIGPQDNPDAPVMADLGTGGSVHRHAYYRVATDGKTLVTVTTPVPDKKNKLVAHDIASGKRAWEAQVESDKIVTPLAIDGSAVVAVSAEDLGQGPARLVRVDLAAGKPGELKPGPNGRKDTTLASFRFVWADNRAYAVYSKMSGGAAIDSIYVIG
jgi:hypothetical protein